MDFNQIFAGKNKFVFIGVIAVILLVLLLVFFDRSSGPVTTPSVTPQGYLASSSNALPTVEGGTRETATNNIPTPNLGATSTPANVAAPSNVVQTGNIASRWFEINGENNQFSPNTIVVNAGDVINLTLKAIDGDYDIYFPDFGASLSAKKGGSDKVQFQAANYGEYHFSCTACQGSVNGTLIVNQK